MENLGVTGKKCKGENKCITNLIGRDKRGT